MLLSMISFVCKAKNSHSSFSKEFYNLHFLSYKSKELKIVYIRLYAFSYLALWGDVHSFPIIILVFAWVVVLHACSFHCGVDFSVNSWCKKNNRYTVGKITPVPAREVRYTDFAKQARIKMFFPKKGSQLTPPHYSLDFYWKDYCPMVFRFVFSME